MQQAVLHIIILSELIFSDDDGLDFQDNNECIRYKF